MSRQRSRLSVRDKNRRASLLEHHQRPTSECELSMRSRDELRRQRLHRPSVCAHQAAAAATAAAASVLD
eukprot:2156784-Pleurochrysis_carterae.AAC.2